MVKQASTHQKQPPPNVANATAAIVLDKQMTSQLSIGIKIIIIIKKIQCIVHWQKERRVLYNAPGRGKKKKSVTTGTIGVVDTMLINWGPSNPGLPRGRREFYH